MKSIKEYISDEIENADVRHLKELREFFTLETNDIVKSINKKIDESEFKDKKCAVCGRNLSDVEEPLVLYFGKRGFRKRGFFCGIDCMTYFLNNYRNIKEAQKLKDENNNFSNKIYF